MKQYVLIALLLVGLASADGWTASQASHDILYVDTVTSKTDASPVVINDANGVRIPTLVSCDTIDTDASGTLLCGSDAAGGGAVLPGGSANQMLRHDGTSWVVSPIITDNGVDRIITTRNNEVSLTLRNSEATGRDWRLVSAGTAGGIGAGKFSVYDATGGASRLTIDTGGNVGIGTTTPSATLQVVGSTDLGQPGTGNLVRIYGSQAGGTGSYASIFMNPVRAGQLILSGGGGSASSVNEFNITATTVPATDNTYTLGTTNSRWQNLRVGTGDSSFAGNLGLGTTTPAAKLDVIGTVKITDGTQAAGDVLTSDANGVASWQAPATGGGWADIGTAVHLSAAGDNVGIGTASPDTKLHVVGAICAETSDTNCAPTAGDVRGDRLCIGTDCRNAWPAAGAGAGGWTDGTGVVYTNVGSDEVGIGTTTPGAALHISRGATAAIYLESTDAAAPNGKNFELRSSQNGEFIIFDRTAGNLNRFNIDTNGRIGIGGESNPTATLHVQGNVRIVDGTQGAGEVLTSDGTGAASWQPIPTSPALLAYATRNPGGDTTVNAGGSFADIDATNLRVTFTTPPSGRVLVRLTGIADSNSGEYFWNLRESGADIANTDSFITESPYELAHSISIVVSPSAGVHTYRWGHRTTGSGKIRYGNGRGIATMEVYALP